MTTSSTVPVIEDPFAGVSCAYTADPADRLCGSDHDRLFGISRRLCDALRDAGFDDGLFDAGHSIGQARMMGQRIIDDDARLLADALCDYVAAACRLIAEAEV